MIRILIFIVAGMSFVYVTTTKLATLPIPDANPDSRIYFMDNWAEKLKLLTIKDPEEKLGKLMEYSDEKMGEIQYLLDNEKDIKLLEKVLPKHERYIEEALGQLAKIEGGSEGDIISTGSSWASEISDRVLEKKEVLSDVDSDLAEEDIKKTEIIIQKIIEQVEGPIKEIIVYKTENTNKAIEDQQEEDKNQQQEEEKDALSESEKLYYIWIDSIYAKALPKESEPFFVRMHIRRRDNECKFFSGKMIVKIDSKEWQSSVSEMQPSDDLWSDLGPIDLQAGTYIAEGSLVNNSGLTISTKEFVMIVD